MDNDSCPITCGCVGYGFVPEQQFECMFENAETALRKGTLFPELELTIEEYGKVCKRMGGAV